MLPLAPLLLALTTGCHPAPRAASSPTGSASAPEPARADILARSDLPPTVDSPLPDDPMGATVHRLSNGLTVYVSPDPTAPRITSWIAVRTGSRNDPADSTGLAHYLEHMLFKGTDELGTMDAKKESAHIAAIAELYDRLRATDDPEARANILAEIDGQTQAAAAYAIPNELDRTYAALGIQGLNAFTSDEVTAYIADVPANRLEAWARVEAERFADPVFRLFYPELEAVYEEKNLSLDNPYRQVQRALLQALFPEHPYGTQPTIGKSEHLKNPAYADMVAYFQRWYVPNNMAVILAGDVDPAKALPVLERTLGRWQPRPLAERPPAKIRPLQGRTVRDVVTEGEQTVTLAWLALADSDPREPTLQILDALMDNARTGLLNTHLELPQLVPDAGSWFDANLDGGYFAVRARLKDGQSHDEVERLLLGVVGRLKAGEFSDEDLAAIKLHVRMGQARSLESRGERAGRMLDAFISRRSWADALARDERLQTVTREDVVRLAQDLLGESYVVVRRKAGKHDVPKLAKPTITPVPLDATRQSQFAREILALPADPIEPRWLEPGRDYALAELPAGRLVTAPNPINDLFSLSFEFDLGTRRAPLLCLALDVLQRSGTPTLDPEALQKKLYALGTTISTHCDADGSSIDMTGIDENLEASVELLRTWLKEAVVTDQTVRRRVEAILSERRENLDDSDVLFRALAEYARVGTKSSYLAEPSNRALSRARPKKLAATLRRLPTYAHRTLYFGPRKGDAVARAVELGPGSVAVRRPPTRYRKIRRSEILFLDRETAKAQVALTIPLGQRPKDERPAARLLGQYLGGDMSSVVFQEIREARGLAYYAYGTLSAARRTGDDWAFFGGMGTQADKTQDALDTYFERVLHHTVEPARLQTTLTAIDEQFRTGRIPPRWVGATLDGWLLRGEARDPRPWLWSSLRALGADDLTRRLAELTKRPFVIAIVGDRGRIDPSALGKLAPVRTIRPEDLFSYGPFPKAPTGGPAQTATP